MDRTPYIVDYKHPTSSDNTWYRISSDGWIEQGGVFSNTAETTNITLPKRMANTYYYASSSLNHGGTGWTATVNTTVITKAVNYITIMCWYNSSFTTGLISWEVKGLIDPTIMPPFFK